MKFLKKGVFLVFTGICFLISLLENYILLKEEFIIVAISINLLLFILYKNMASSVFCYNLKYFEIFLIILPMLGYLLVFLDIIFHYKQFSKKVKIDIPEENVKIIKKIKIENEIDIFPISLVKEMDNTEEKKKTIVRLNLNDIKILKEFLEDDDVEVEHYAATKLNSIEEEFNIKIKNAKIKKDDTEYLTWMMKYCTSGLLDEVLLDIYSEKIEEKINQNKSILKKVNATELLNYYQKIGKSKFLNLSNNLEKSSVQQENYEKSMFNL